MIRNVHCPSISLFAEVVVLRVIDSWREHVSIVSLPEANVHVESRGKGRDLHVVRPFSRLAHLLDVLFKLLLQLCLGVVCSVDACRCGRGGGAFGVPAQVVHSHVLTVKV